MCEGRAQRAAMVIGRATQEHREKALRRWLAVIETQMLQAMGRSACAAVAEVALRHGVSASAIWRWRRLVCGEYEPIPQLRWLIEQRAIPNSEILSLEELLNVGA